LRKAQVLPIWSAGCADGCEPYSLSILLRRIVDAEWQDRDGSRFVLGSLAGRIMPAWAELRGRSHDDASVVDHEFAALLATYRDSARPEPPEPR
jgi:acyl-CoA-binding protein